MNRFEDWRDVWLPKTLNQGPWLTAYALPELEARARERIVLPVCSFLQSPANAARLGALVMPPLFVEAMDDSLRAAIVERVRECFPYINGSIKRRAWKGLVDVVDLPPQRARPPARRPRVIAFSVDTSVEEHGPHLPLATDRIQSYAALERAAADFADDVMLAPPLEYGFLRWGLPAGMSVDLSPAITTRYVTGYVNALVEWARPDAVYVVDVHGAPIHRKAVEDGVNASAAPRKMFRYLHQPIADQIAAAGDPHAGGIETAMILTINPALVDARWWPGWAEDLARDEMKLALAIELAQDMPRFIEFAETHAWNGIVGNIRNFSAVNGAEMLDKVCGVARDDLRELLSA